MPKKKQEEELIQRARKLIEESPGTFAGNTIADNVQQVIEELRIHQAELEIQNEDLRRTSLELEELQQRYFDLYHFAPVGYFTLTEKNLISDANLTGVHMLGGTRLQLLGQRFPRFISRDDADLFYEFHRKLHVSDEPQACELKMAKEDQSAFHARLQGSRIRDAGGLVESVQVVVIDITEQKNAELALKNHQQLLRDVLRCTADWIWEIDTEGRFTYVDAGAKSPFGYDPEELMGKSFFHYLTEKKEASRFKREVLTIMRSQAPISDLQKWFMTKDKREICCRLDGVPVFDPKRELVGYRGLTKDVTEKMTSDLLISDLTHSLLTSQEKERLLIANELHDGLAQNLMSAKILVKEMSDLAPKSAAEIKKKAAAIVGVLDHSTQDVRNLAYDLYPPGIMEMDFFDFLAEYFRDFPKEHNLKIAFTHSGAKDLKLPSDLKINIFRILQEALYNIGKHAETDRAAVGLVGAASDLILRIEDSGKGFEVGKTLKIKDMKKRLGLRSMEERAKLFQGTFKIESKPGQGTKISIRFPVRKNWEAHADGR